MNNFINSGSKENLKNHTYIHSKELKWNLPVNANCPQDSISCIQENIIHLHFHRQGLFTLFLFSTTCMGACIVVQSCLTLCNPVAPLSMKFARYEYWNRTPGIEAVCLGSPALAGRLFVTSVTWEYRIIEQLKDDERQRSLERERSLVISRAWWRSPLSQSPR